ncbi:hypothetical protein J6Z48_02385 [bacterium]|nr:hypothetical protein [bacterium]
MIDFSMGVLKLDKNRKYLAMLAPSFVTMYEYPSIVYKLRMLGFDKVTEVTFGAKMTNLFYYSFLKDKLEKGEKKTWIASPCPTLVTFIRTKYPHLVENLVPVHSPVGCMALICKKFYPNHKIVFIGPCLTKKLEAQELGTIDAVLTFKELNDWMVEENIPEEVTDSKYHISFDKFYNDYTKIYPTSGGLSDTLNGSKILSDKDILIMEGIPNLVKVFDQFKDGVYKNYKFLDILNCMGGCINGPGMFGTSSIEERRKRIFKYRDYAWRYEKDLGRTGYRVHVEDLDFHRDF